MKKIILILAILLSINTNILFASSTTLKDNFIEKDIENPKIINKGKNENN